MTPRKRIINLHVPTSICNFRCHYCYLAQREECYQGKQPDMKYTPEHVAQALSPERLGGICHIVSSADGETLLTNNIDLYYKAIVLKGHYLEIVTNMTITPMLDKILSWDKSLLRHVEFKASFHYLELKKRKLLDVFANNVNRAWENGASVNIEITPSDELITYIGEVKDFSMVHFGALPHITIARDDRTAGIENLTNLSDEEYVKTWSTFDSDFWRYKKTIFGKKQTGFCYAGLWQFSVDIASGEARQCYLRPIGNIFEDPSKPIPAEPIGKCPIAHCYNGHIFLTAGLIPGVTDVKYGDIRNRVRADGTEWLQPELKAFFNSKLCDSNKEWSLLRKKKYIMEKRFLERVRELMVKRRFYEILHNWKERHK